MAEHLVADNNSLAEHTGSTIVGGVIGQIISSISDEWITIDGYPVVTGHSIMDIPNHMYAPLLYHSHKFNPNTFAQDFITVEGLPLAIVGSGYSDDATYLITTGKNQWVKVVT